MPAAKQVFTNSFQAWREGETYIYDPSIPNATEDNPTASLDYIRAKHATGDNTIVFMPGPDQLDIEEDENMIRLAGTSSPEEDGEVPYTEDLATLASHIRKGV